MSGNWYDGLLISSKYENDLWEAYGGVDLAGLLFSLVFKYKHDNSPNQPFCSTRRDVYRVTDGLSRNITPLLTVKQREGRWLHGISAMQLKAIKDVLNSGITIKETDACKWGCVSWCFLGGLSGGILPDAPLDPNKDPSKVVLPAPGEAMGAPEIEPINGAIEYECERLITLFDWISMLCEKTQSGEQMTLKTSEAPIVQGSFVRTFLSRVLAGGITAVGVEEFIGNLKQRGIPISEVSMSADAFDSVFIVSVSNSEFELNDCPPRFEDGED